MDDQEQIVTPLRDWHVAHGGQIGTWFGCALPDHFGDWRVEYSFLMSSVALVDTNFHAYLEFTGADRTRYLNAILTNNIRDLQRNQGTVSLFLSPQGHIQAEVETFARGESILGVSFAMIRTKLIEALDKYIIMDDVMLSDRTAEWGSLGLHGPRAIAAAQRVNVDATEWRPEELHDVEVAGICGLAVKRIAAGAVSLEVFVPRQRIAPLWEALLQPVKDEGGGPSGYMALNSVRLEQGLPWFGCDFGEKQIPHEAGLQNSHISYVKGCYTGQEIVERVRSRGQVNRVRVMVQFGAHVAPETILVADGKEVGFVTSSGFSPQRNAEIGMAYVRREKSSAGTVLDASGIPATVIDLNTDPAAKG